jgi:hypothetical protein
MLSNTLSFLSSRNVSDQVSHPYKTTGKKYLFIYLYFNISVYYKFILYSVRDDDMRSIIKQYDARQWTGCALATKRVKERALRDRETNLRVP